MRPAQHYRRILRVVSQNQGRQHLGLVSGSSVTLRMSFALGGSQPTPECLVVMDVSASGVTNTRLSSSYNGSDSCEPLVALGTSR